MSLRTPLKEQLRVPTESLPRCPGIQFSRLQLARRFSPTFDPLLLLLVCGFLFFYGLNVGELYRTESLRAIIGKEFLRTGNWIVPTLYGDPLFSKPPGMYAAIALASWPLGDVREWTARLPSALAATVTVFLFYWFFKRRLGRPAGLIAALVLPISLMWLDKASAAEIDMLQVMWVSLAILGAVRAIETPADFGATAFDDAALGSSKNASALWWLAAMLAVTGGVLTKWTAPAFFYGTMIPLLWRRGQLRLLWRWPHLVGIALGMIFCLTWVGLAASQGDWEVFAAHVSREALVHLSPKHFHRSYPWLESLMHPLRILAASLPLSALALAALWPGFVKSLDARGRSLLQLFHCWTWPNILFWSAVPEHGTRQSFPLFPGLAGLAALVCIAWLTGRWRWRIRWLTPRSAFIALLCAWLGAKLIFVHVVVPERDRKRQPRHKAEMVAAQVPLGKTLYIFRLKDEGIMFYYARPVRRLYRVDQLPSSDGPVYCILDRTEWEQADWPTATLLHLEDEQGAPIVLVRKDP